MGFRFTGFADEAGGSLDAQMRALQEAGWRDVEIRLVGEKNVCDMNDAEWDGVWSRLRAAGIGIVCFGGQIGNWARPIGGDFRADREELERVLPRMKKTGARLVRIMSYPNDPERPLSQADWKRVVVRRLRELARIAEDHGVILGHENCSGYGSQGPQQYLDMAEGIGSPALRMILDTGNNSLYANDLEATWRFYEACREHIVHVHIKCYKRGPDGKLVTCYPDEDPVQRRILGDLKRRGYDGWLSIEPHMAAAVHEGKHAADADAARAQWVEYARRLETLAKQV